MPFLQADKIFSPLPFTTKPRRLKPTKALDEISDCPVAICDLNLESAGSIEVLGPLGMAADIENMEGGHVLGHQHA
jgi:hypothetical protein